MTAVVDSTDAIAQWLAPAAAGASAPRAPRPFDEAKRCVALRRYLLPEDASDAAGDEAFELLTAVAAELTGSPRALINFVDAEQVWSRAAHGGPRGAWARDTDYCAWSVLEARGLHIPDLPADARTAAAPGTRAGWRMYAGTNLVTPDGHHIGTLCVLDSIPRRLTAPQLELLERLARQVMALLELRRAQAQLIELATHDALTGLANRLAWSEEFGVLLPQTRRADAQALATRFRRTLGNAEQVPEDACARIRDGMQGANRSHSLGYGEDLQRRRPPEAGMRAPRGTCSALPLSGLTVSIGVASSEEAADAAALMALADRRCYVAKRLGRNRVVAAGSALRLRPASPGGRSDATSRV